MVYRAIGLMSGSSLDGLDIAFVEFHENAGKWTFEIIHADCYAYSEEWTERLKNATSLNGLEYQLLHVDYGHYIGKEVNRFIETYGLQYKVALIGSHGHTTFHVPSRKMTAQLGDGASIAAETGLPVVSDLRSMDIAFGGQGAPIVPIGERILLNNYNYFLNIGGIANISYNSTPYIAFDVCPANRVLNMLAAETGKPYDDAGNIARSGNLQTELLEQLNSLDFYRQSPPRSLANDFGTDIVYPLLKRAGCSIPDALRTYTEHIAIQIKASILLIHGQSGNDSPNNPSQPSTLLVTGGGAFNDFLVELLKSHLSELNIVPSLPNEALIKYKEAVIMALIGVLRWREEVNVFASVTGASTDSVGGALWMGAGS